MKVTSLITAGLVAVGLTAGASSHSGLSYSTSTSVKSGTWTSRFAKAQSHTKKYGLPLVVVWVNPGCHNCDRFCSSVGKSSSFESWRKTSKCDFVLGIGTSKSDAANAKAFARDPSGTFPYCAVYLDPIGTASPIVKKKTFTGSGMSASAFKSKILGILKNYVLITQKATTGGSVNHVYWQKKGTKVTLKATPKSKYKFVGWYKDDKRVSTKASYTITVKSKATYTAKFKKK